MLKGLTILLLEIAMTVCIFMAIFDRTRATEYLLWAILTLLQVERNRK